MVAIGLGLAFGVYMALADATVFRSVVPASQTAIVAGASAMRRFVHFVIPATLDELQFRLVLVSAVTWLLTATFGRRDGCVWGAIVIVAVLYLGLHPAYLASLQPTRLVVARELFLHVSAGILWGYLYWKQGLAASVAGHVSAHITLQPLLGWLMPS
jgi:hypothetical protein